MITMTIVYGFINSAILVVAALGFNITFGISGVANFAHGALYIAAGFLTYLCLTELHFPYWIAAPAAVIITGALAAVIYRVVLLRVRGLVVSEVIATFAIGLAILELFRFLGFVGFEFTLPVFVDASVPLGNTLVDAQRLLVVASGIVLTVFLWLFTHYTKTGLAFRGIAQDERTALTLGINADRVAALSMAFGGAYAAVAALVILPLGTIAVNEGYDVMINSLAVCIMGGLGSTGGLIAASFLIGYGQIITATYLGTHWTMIVSLVAILIILIVKPSGLFGHQKELEERT
ncbi:MAG: branched-chain amino acid ABC transporter permease [Deltaproteobacteria bacterium]|nr:branched-chain amino acid ABC transporter permease [Deltaproteobacteria bacterium]